MCDIQAVVILHHAWKSEVAGEMIQETRLECQNLWPSHLLLSNTQHQHPEHTLHLYFDRKGGSWKARNTHEHLHYARQKKQS